MQFSYYPVNLTTGYGPAVAIANGTGTRTFTNRFGATTTTALTVATPGTDYANNLLYLNSPFPVDGSGLTWNLATAIQLPGHGPSVLYSQINVYNQSGVVVESDVSRTDGLGSAFLSTVPGFLNVTIGASNINSLAANYGACQAPITFTNGLRAPTQPSASNGAVRVGFNYTVSDGVTYSVSGALVFTMSSAFATAQDALGNPYQVVTGVTGTRLYTYLPTNAQLTSTVSGLSAAAYANADQRFYPYSLLASAPGVYTMTTAPFFDYDGVEFSVSPSVPENGVAPGTGTQYNATSLYYTTPEPTAVLTEGFYVNLPVVQFQQQSYALLQ